MVPRRRGGPLHSPPNHLSAPPPGPGIPDSRLLEVLPVGVCVCAAPEGTVVRFNERAAAIWGRRPVGDGGERFSGAHALRLPDGRPIPRADAPMAEVLRTGQPVVDRLLVVERPDGSHRSVRVDVAPLRDEEGQLIAAVQTFREVAEQEVAPAGRRGVRQTSELAHERVMAGIDADRRRLVELFDHAPAFMAVLTGPDHVFEQTNARYDELVGGRAAPGLSVREALPEVVEQGFIELLDRVYTTGEAYVASGASVRLQRDDGGQAERIVEFVYLPLRDSDDRTYGIVALGVDQTERLQAEADLAIVSRDSERWRRLYEAVLSTTPDLVYVFDRDHRFVYANRALLELWGRTYDDAIGKTCLELGYEPWHAEMHSREIEQVLATGQPVRGEVPFTGTRGPRIYDYIFVPVFAADGSIERVAGTTRDITERVELQDELQRRAEALQEADRSKDEFIALLAHELRNPLVPLRNGLHLMRLAGFDSSVAERARAMMDRQLDHMVRLIDDLLDASRISRNKMRLQRERVLLTDVIASALETAGPTIDEAGLDLSVRLPPEPVVLDADPTRLAQVVSNLLINSARYTDRGGEVRLTAERADGELIVEVADTGVGIPRESLSTIFDVFAQLDRALERKAGGLGLGLSLVRGLVEMHGGTVAAASEGHGRGSTFTVRLPLPAEVEESALAEEAWEGPGHRFRVLVADDNPDAAESLSALLEALGHQVQTAADGQEAVRVAEAFRPEIVLMDVGMPRLNGLDATRAIRAQPWGERVVVLALTGWGQDRDRARTAEAGCDGHLVKPVDVTALLGAIEEAKGRLAAPVA